MNLKVGMFTIESLEKHEKNCFQYKASTYDAANIKRFAWVKIYPMANFKETDQTYKDMDAHFETLLNIAPLTQSNLTKIYSTFNKTSSPPGQQNHKVLMKYYKDGDLKSFMARSNNNILPGQRLKLMNNLYAAVEYMHQKNFSHNSIAPEHVLIDEGVAYLGGLSSAKHHPSGLPIEAKNKDLIDLGHCLCFIRFNNVYPKIEEIKQNLSNDRQSSAMQKVAMTGWVEKNPSTEQNVIKNGEKVFFDPSFTDSLGLQKGQKNHIPLSFATNPAGNGRLITGEEELVSDIFPGNPNVHNIQLSGVNKVKASPKSVPNSFQDDGGYE